VSWGTATVRANQLRLWFASMAYVLMCAVRVGALVRISVRRIKVAMASSCTVAGTWSTAAVRLNAAAQARASPA